MMKRALFLLGLFLLSALSAAAQNVISDYNPAGSVGRSDKLLMQQGPRTTPYTYATPLKLFGAMLGADVTAALGFTPLSTTGAADATTVTPTGGATRTIKQVVTDAATATMLANNVTLRAPNSNDDTTRGYAIGDMWLSGNDVYTALKVTARLAVWQLMPAAHGLPIDAIGGVAPVFACGTARLTAAYAGHAVNVVRTSDSTALDVDFLADGALNVAAIDALSPSAPVRVATCYDQSGAVNNGTAITANRPAMAFTNTIGPARSIVFDTTHASSTGPAFTGFAYASAGAATAGAVSFMTLMRGWNSAGVDIYPVEFAGTNAVYAGYSSTGVKFALNRTGAQLAQITTAKPSVTPLVFGFTLKNNAAGTFFVGSKIATPAQTVLVTALTAATLGSSASDNAGAGTSGGMETVAAFAYARQLSAAEIANGQAALYRLFKVYPQVRDNVYVIGDSITAGTFQSMNVNYTRRIIPNLAVPLNVTVDGRFGDQIANMDASFATRYGSVLNTSARNNIITLFAGTNDIASGATGAATWAHVQSFCAQARTAGWKIALATMLPRSDLTSPEQTEWANYLALMRAGWPAVADALIDPQSDDVMGPFAATANSALYQDGVHPADGIPIYFTSLFANAINGLLH